MPSLKRSVNWIDATYCYLQLFEKRHCNFIFHSKNATAIVNRNITIEPIVKISPVCPASKRVSRCPASKTEMTRFRECKVRAPPAHLPVRPSLSASGKAGGSWSPSRFNASSTPRAIQSWVYASVIKLSRRRR
jgi:hypothetical protein